MEKEKPSDKKSEPVCDSEKNQILPKEIGGFENREEPTQHGDWTVGGRCSDF